jgi:hypothetical protein
MVSAFVVVQHGKIADEIAENKDAFGCDLVFLVSDEKVFLGQFQLSKEEH